MYIYTNQGRAEAEKFIQELEAKRKEILDAGKDTADETELPTPEDILSDVAWDNYVEETGEYFNNWGVTDNYDSERPICLVLNEDILWVDELAA